MGVLGVNFHTSQRGFGRSGHRELAILQTALGYGDDFESMQPALTSRIKLNGVALARRNLRKPAFLNTSASRASPAWAPRAVPTSSESECAQQSVVEAA